MGLGTTKLPRPKKLHNVDDTTNKSGKITHSLHLDVKTNGIHKEMKFLVANIGREDIILGYPWLVTYEPWFSWQHGTIDNKYQPIVLTTQRPNWDLVDKDRSLQEKACIVQELEKAC